MVSLYLYLDSQIVISKQIAVNQVILSINNQYIRQFENI